MNKIFGNKIDLGHPKFCELPICIDALSISDYKKMCFIVLLKIGYTLYTKVSKLSQFPFCMYKLNIKDH